ncbi:MAG: CPBP family intramembrane metalloprotease [Anaerolineales bacterium]|nr:CPBP family intramembrane metalloprotease [Chloroflexota bacterium]MBL6982038.1 CPBP family intramembrane metalloprotease [Anaerolineales bacterium]
MNVTTAALPNSKAKLQERLQEGSISLRWPVIIVFARLIFAIMAQALVAGLFMLQGHPTPWQAAAPWWIVYGTLIDIGCFVLLARLARREGIRLVDLISFQRLRLRRDLFLGVGFIVLYLFLAIGGGILFGILVYGTDPAPAVMVPLPLWGTLYSLIVWPLIWAFAEEMTYQGYALPRLELLTKRGWLAILIVGFGWALQHSALPLMADWRWAIFRFGSSLLIGIILPIIYLRTRRLLPFIIAHWAANFVSVLMTVVLPLLSP